MSETATLTDTAQRWLHEYCERQASKAGVESAVVLLGQGSELKAAAQWPQTVEPSASLTAAARAAHRRASALVLTPPVGASSQRVRIVSMPLSSEQGPLGVLALTTQAGPTDSDQSLLSAMQPPAEQLSTALHSPSQSSPKPSSALWQLQAQLLGPHRLEQAASALTSELASSLSFERVSLGLSQRGELKVAALSHSAEFGPKQALTRALAGAMQEAIDQRVSITYPQPSEAPPRILLAHTALAAQAPGSILSVPLIDDGQAIGALCFERSRASTQDEQRNIEQLACALAPLIALKQRAEQGWYAKACQAIKDTCSGNQRGLKLAWISGIVAALMLAFVPVSHRVGAPVRLEGAVQRVMAAPIDGYLHVAHVRPGDPVKQGQLLVELAQQDLLLQSNKWQAELTQHQNSAAAALARNDRAQYALAQARADEASAQLSLAQSQLARTKLSAPIEGIVIKGDLSQSLGAPVQRGEVLLTLAPREAYRLIIEVDERDIGQIELGGQGKAALSAVPAERFDFTVTRISPVAISSEGRNAFEVEAQFDKRQVGLRPGLQGIAKIEAGSKPWAWIATHRIFEWLQMQLWKWSA